VVPICFFCLSGLSQRFQKHAIELRETSQKLETTFVVVTVGVKLIVKGADSMHACDLTPEVSHGASSMQRGGRFGSEEISFEHGIS